MWGFSIVAAIMLFLHALAAFTGEVTALGGERLRGWLQRLTRHDAVAALLGAGFTALVQSSSAVTSMVVGLVGARALPARGGLCVMIGANVGTTLTAWLVAAKLPGLGPIFISLGGLASLLGPLRWRPAGKAVFFFGLVFLALELTSQALAPLAEHATDPAWQAWLAQPLAALTLGALLTAVVQSSSVASGLAVLVVSQGLLPPESAVWMVAGANLGTTSTALLASAALSTLARRMALLNTAFNVVGVALFATLMQPVVAWVLALGMPAASQVALVHTLFNLSAALLMLALLPWAWRPIEAWLLRPMPTDDAAPGP